MRPGLSPADVEALDVWRAVRRTRGESAASTERAVRRLTAFARHSEHGLLEATRGDLTAFISSWARKRDLTLKQFVRTTTLSLTVAALRNFYAWASTRGLVDPSRSPVHNIVLPPCARTAATLLGPKDGPLYEALLSNPHLGRRVRAVLLLLAHGLSASDIVSARVEDLDVSAGVLVLRHARVRSVLLTDKTIALLTDYLLETFGSVGPIGWLFPVRGRRQAHPDVIRDVVRRAAASTFPSPAQAAKRRRICAAGFRELFLRRLVSTRVAPDCLAALARFDRLHRIRRYARPDLMIRARRELTRVAGRWKRWL